MRNAHNEGGSPEHPHAPSAANQKDALDTEATPQIHHTTFADVDPDLIRRSPEMRQFAQLLARLAIRVAIKKKREEMRSQRVSGEEADC